MTLLERIEWILRTRGIGQRELARRSNLNDERHLGVIVSRLRKNPHAEIERPTLVALAQGGEVSLDWLATGNGSPEGEPGRSIARPGGGTGPESSPPGTSTRPETATTDRPPMTLEDALDRAFDRSVHSLHDALAVRMAFGALPPLRGVDDSVAAARAWLDAAADLRRSGREVTVAALLERVTIRLNRTIAELSREIAEAGPARLPEPSPSERPVEGTETMPSESPPPQEGGSGLREPFQVRRDEHGNLTVTGGNPIAPATGAAKPAKAAGERKRHR